jgi:hypothetical protein
MDYLKEFENIDKRRNIRENQELIKITHKDESQVYPYRNTSKKCVGEYYAKIEDKIAVYYIKINLASEKISRP